MKGLLAQAGLWKEIKLNPSASSLVAVVPSLEVFSAVWRMLRRTPSSTGICASCLTVALGVSVGVLSSIEGCSSGESRMHCTTVFISPFSLFKRAASFTSEADGKTFFKLCSFSSKTGEADLNVGNTRGASLPVRVGGQFLCVSGNHLQPQHFPL